MSKNYCTAWPDQMFGVDLSDLCYDHDAAYRTGDVMLKFKGDFILAIGILKRSYRAKQTWQKGIIAGSAFLVLAVILTAGTIKWHTDHLFDNLR